LYLAFSFVCPPKAIVTSVFGGFGWGINSLGIGCSDGSVSARAGDPDREIAFNGACSTGFSNVQVWGGARCGLGRIQPWCKGVKVNGNIPASDTPMGFGLNLGCWKGVGEQVHECPPPSKIVGIEGKYGLVEYDTNPYQAATLVTSIDKYICSK
jgi:hypothetical protein